jgi:hypothetical protein
MTGSLFTSGFVTLESKLESAKVASEDDFPHEHEFTADVVSRLKYKASQNLTEDFYQHGRHSACR